MDLAFDSEWNIKWEVWRWWEWNAKGQLTGIKQLVNISYTVFIKQI